MEIVESTRTSFKYVLWDCECVVYRPLKIIDVFPKRKGLPYSPGGHVWK